MRLKHLLSVFLTLLTLSVGQMWGASYTITFSTGSNDGSKVSTSTACSDIVSDGSSYLSGNLVTATNAYSAGSAGLKLGKSSNSPAGDLKMNLSTAGRLVPTKVSVYAKYYSNSAKGTVQMCTNLGSNTATTTTGSFTAYDYSYTGTSSLTYVEVKSSKYIWVEKIVVSYKGTVTFDANGGSCSPTSLTQSSATASITLPTPTRDGFTCTGWYTAESGGTKRGNAGATYTPDASETLYAQWEAETPAFVITPATNDEDKGTVSLEGSVITGSPASCHEYASPAYTISPSGKATVTQGTGDHINEFTVSNLLADVTITINFKEKAAGKTVNFNAGPGVPASASLTEDCAGAGVTLPDVDLSGLCKGWTTFAGWATSAVTDSSTTEVTLCSSPYVPNTNNQILYAVYSKDKSGASSTETIAAADLGVSNSTAIETKTVGTITIKGEQGNNGTSTNVPKYYSAESSIRCYASNDLTISSTNTISQIDFTYDGSYNGGTITPNSGAWASTATTNWDQTWQGSTTSVKFRVGNSQWRVTNIKVTTGGGSTTYYCSDPNCCTELGSINGSVSWTNGEATVSWANDGNVSSYSVTCKQGETNKGTVGSITGTTTKSCTVTGLTAGQTYTFTINASGDATHCDASQVISATAPKITASADLGDFGYAQGSNPEEQSFTVSGTALTENLTVTAPANYLIKVGTGEWSSAGGNKSITVSTPPSNLSSTTIYVKAATGLNEGDNPSGNIEITGGGAAKVEVAVSATITSACAVDPTIGAATLKAGGAFGLDGVAVSVTGMNPGTNCTWTDYGFYWGTVDNKKAHKVEIGNSGNATSFETTLAFTAPAQFAAGTTYYFCAYGKNAKAGAEIICGTEASFTPYTVSYNKNDENATGEVATVVVNAGGSVTLPNASAFSLDCNDMTNWALNSASGTQYDPEVTYSNINANAEFFAIWNTRTYTVQYAAGTTPVNGGAITGSHANDTKTCGVVLDLPGVTFYSTGYTQDGWAKSDGGSKTNGLSGSYSSNQAQTFYPHWLINTYTIYKGEKTGCSDNDFTVASSVDHYGSVSVTASPDAAHKGAAKVSVYPSENATVSGTTISNITGNITVSVSFAAKETATIILHDAGGQSTVSGTHYEMDNYTLPNTAAACTESELYGWYTEAYVDQATAPSGAKYIAKNTSKALAAGENHFYAVYATVTPDAADTYTKITSTSELVTGDYLIVGTPSTTMYAMQNAYHSNEESMADASRTVNNNQISNPANTQADYIWRITRSNNNVTIYSAANSKYFGISVGHVSLQDAADNFTFDVSDGKWAFTAGSYHLKYDSYFKAGDTKVYQAYLFKRDALVAGPYTTSPNCTTHDLASAIDPNSPVGGSVELGKTTILETKTTTATATPSEHYTFSHWTISGTGAGLSHADGEGKSTDNPVTVTMGTADATITAHFTEKPKCTVEFYNNGGSALSSTTYWFGETPSAPTLNDGTTGEGNACDETSDKHYGWTQTAWQQTITKDDVDAKTAANVKVYTKGSTLPAIEAGDNGKTIKYYAVWAHAEDNSVQKNYTLSISYSDCPASYDNSLPTKNASEVGGTGTFAVSFGGTGVMNQANQIQFRKSSKGAGYIYNTVDLGNITGITTNNNSIVYNIGTSENPSSGTSGGYFKIYNNSDNTLNPSGITINFTKTTGSIAYSAFLTNCCNQLEDINGEVDFTDPTTAVVTWDKLANVVASNAYAVSYRTGEAAYGTTNVGAIDLTGAKATCTITDLSCNTSYDFKIAVTAATGYCDKEQVIAGQNSGKYTITSADGGNPTGGTFATLESACSGDNVDLLAEATTGYNFAGWTITKASSGTVSPAADEESTSFTMPAENVTVSAAFNAISYDILYENMDGATNHVSNPSSYTVEDAISLGDPTKEGYNFGGWFTDDDLAAGHEASSPAIAAGSTGDKTFYAKWIADNKWSVAITAPSHGTITVSWNGGENSFYSGSQNIDKNTDITITATPSAGYELTSLKIGDADFTSGNTHKLTSSIVISATFSIINYDITYHLNGGTNSQDNPATFTINDEDIIFDEPTKTGYDFDDWYSNENFEGDAVNGVTHGTHENVEVWAKWTAKESTITWNAHDGSDPTSSKYTYDGSTVELPTPTRDHYDFDGWFTEAEGGTKITEIGTENKPVADVTYHAHWTEVTYTVKWSVNGDDTYAVGGPTTSVTYNTKVTKLPTAPTSNDCDDAKKFIGWRASAIEGTSASAPSGVIFKDIAHSPAITDNITFFAVFADVTGGQSITLSFPDDNSDYNGLQNYTSTWTAIKGDYSWSVENFNNNNWGDNWTYIKCGRKNNASTGKITTSDAIGFPVDTVLINVGSITEGNVSTAKLYISSASNFATKTSMDIDKSDGTKKLEIASPAKDMYYQIEYVCTSASSNGLVQISSITYKQKFDTINFVTTCPNCTAIPTFDAAPAVSEISCTGATVTATNGLETLGEGEGCNIREYGFVWGTTETPTVASNTGKRTVSENIAEGTAWSHSITDLEPGTQYYVRAYAENKIGVAYSAAQSFWTNGVSSIAVTTAPTKTNYIVGEAFDATGMVVTATLANGNEVDVTEDCTYSNTAFNAAGNVNFPINYSLCEMNVQTTQPINVYTLTVTEGTNPSYGTATNSSANIVSVTGLGDHKTYDITVTSNNAELVDNNNGTYSVINPTGNVTVRVDYKAAEQVKVYYKVNGVAVTGLTQDVYQSETTTLPTASALATAMTAQSMTMSDYGNLAGWSETEFGYQTSEPTMVTGTPTINAEKTYFAVFTNLNKVRIDESVITSGSYPSQESTKQVGGINFKYHNILSQSGYLQLKWNGTPYGYIYNSDEIVNVLRIESADYNVSVYACTTAGTTTGSAISAETREDMDPYVYILPANTSYFKLSAEKDVQCKPDYIDIYYAEGTAYYTTQFSTLTFKKANGTTDKTIQKATNDSYALTNADVPAENDTPANYEFLNKWSDGTNIYAMDAVVTLSSDIVLKPCWDIEINDNAEVPAANVVASDITVNEGKTLTLTLTEDTKLGDIFVENGGTLTISGAKKVDAKDFYLEAQEGYSGQVKGNGTIAVYGNAYYDLTLNTSGTMDNTKWYAFAVPFQVDAATGIQRLSNDGVTSPAQFNGHYVLLQYDRSLHNTSSNGWKYVTAGETLEPGKFYMVALNSNVYNRLRMTKKADAPLNNMASITLEYTGGELSDSWNAVANNALAYVQVSAEGGNASLKVQTYNSVGDNYTAFDFNKVTLTVGTPFFIQAAVANDPLVVSVAASTTGTTIKAPKLEAIATEEFQIRLGNDENSYYDILYVSASEDALNKYQIGHDLAKAGVSTKVPQMYIPAYGAKLCDAEFPLVNNEATFPLTFTAPSAGTYQLYVAVAAQDAELYLLRDGDIIWNLTMGAYQLSLPQGTTTEYSLLLKAKMPQTPTGVDEVGSEKAGAQKLIIEDKVFILRGGKMYDVTGKAVR